MIVVVVGEVSRVDAVDVVLDAMVPHSNYSEAHYWLDDGPCQITQKSSVPSFPPSWAQCCTLNFRILGAGGAEAGSESAGSDLVDDASKPTIGPLTSPEVVVVGAEGDAAVHARHRSVRSG